MAYRVATSSLLASAKAVSSGCLTAAAKAGWPVATARAFTAAADIEVDMSVEVKTSYDVVIMGGGAVGCSIAYNLMKRDPTLQVAVIERDATYANASSVLAAGGIRLQYSNSENVEMCRYSAEFMENMKDHLSIGDEDDDALCDVQYKQTGYLFLTNTESGKEVLEENRETQNAHGAETEILDQAQLRERYPWMVLDDVVAGALGRKYEGSFDPYSMLMAFRRKARAMGVCFIQGEVVGLDADSTDTSEPSEVKGVHVQNISGELTTYSCGIPINACGAWSGLIMQMAGISDWVVVPKLRSMFFVHCPAATYDNVPFTITPEGTYFRREGPSEKGMFVMGRSPDACDDPDYASNDFNVPRNNANHDMFESVMWPTLAEICPAFEELKVVNSWAGFYDYNKLDQNALIGYHPECKNMLVASGFSGHGLMQTPAVGRAVAELALHGSFQTLDLSRMSPGRYLDRDGYTAAPLLERNVI